MSPRKNLADFIAPAPDAAPAMPARTAQAPAAEPVRTEPSQGPAPSPEPAPAAPAAAEDGHRPAARDLVTPARPKITREALKADVPADLALLRRLRAYRADHSMDIRDQVALAVDEWLSGQGY
jgi:hypothetical protein